MPSGPWPTSGCLTMGVAGRTCLANLHGHSIETWPNYFRWNLSIQRSVSTFMDLQMSQLHILLLVAKTPLRHLYLREHSFGHYLRFMTIAQARNKDQYKNWHPCTVWKLLILTAEQHRTAFALPIHASISLFHILSPPQGTWTSQPTALIDSTFACLSIIAKLVTYWYYDYTIRPNFNLIKACMFGRMQ